MYKSTQIENAFFKAKENIILNKNKYLFNKNGFTRNRKVNLNDFIDMLMYMEGNSLPTELLHIFKDKTYSSSAFVQTRNKVSYTLFKDLLYEFNNNLNNNLKFKGYTLLTGDGSVLGIPDDEFNIDTRYHRNQYKDANGIHINAIYDILNKYFVDIYIQGEALKDERKALDNLKIPSNSILVLDRGYKGHQTIYNLHKRNINYVIRIKDIDSNGMINKLDLPDKDFDININYKMTSYKEFASKHKGYKYVSYNRFNYLETGQFVDIEYRLVRFKLPNGNYELLITNLPKEIISIKDLKEIYRLRWNIETSFYSLKYNNGILRIHAKKINSIYQEIYAKAIFYNFVSGIIKCFKSKKGYNINIKHATEVCRLRLKKIRISYKKILEYQIKDRPNRHDKRKLIVSKQFVPFEARAS